MNRRLSVVSAAALVAASVAVSAQNSPSGTAPSRPTTTSADANRWTIDSSHSAAHFSVRHLMVSTVRGQLGQVSGVVEYDGKDVRSIKADVTIDVKGLTTQNQKRDDHLRSADFFDAANHPTITFKSKRIEPGADGAFKIVGDLTIRGTTKEVVLAAEPPAPVTKGMRGLVTGTTATTKVKRFDYGLKYNSMVEAGPVVGDEVTITIDVELGRPAS